VNRLYLVRHGENRANLTKEFSCRRVDYSLTAKGVLQAEQTADHFRDKQIDEIFSSPLKRAQETAQILAARLGLAVTVVEGLREIDVGDLEDQPASAELWAFHNRIVDAWFSGQPEVAFPGGENYVTLRDRVRAALQQIVDGKDGRNLIIVGHGGSLSAAIRELCPTLDAGRFRHRPTHNCSITELAVEQRNGRLQGELIAWAGYTHLHGAAAELVPGTPQPGELDSGANQCQRKSPR
jgi:broad specificity phosphatase PhoE